MFLLRSKPQASTFLVGFPPFGGTLDSVTVSTDTLKITEPVIVTGIDMIHLSGSALTSLITQLAVGVSLQNRLPETVPV